MGKVRLGPRERAILSRLDASYWTPPAIYLASPLDQPCRSPSAYTVNRLIDKGLIVLAYQTFDRATNKRFLAADWPRPGFEAAQWRGAARLMAEGEALPRGAC